MAELPGGTVTFLFTDIEGSTSRWEHQPEAMRVALGFTPQAMAKRLGRRLPLLMSSGRDLPSRQQTLRGAIDWSHDLLDEDERRLFRHLSVFVGGWTLDAAMGPQQAIVYALEVSALP